MQRFPRQSFFPLEHLKGVLFWEMMPWDNLAISTEDLLIYFLHKFGFFSVYFESFFTAWLCQVIWWLHSVLITSMCPVLQGWWSNFVFISHLVLSKPLFFSNSGVETQDPAGKWQKQSWSLALAFGIALPPVETNPSAVSRTACQWLSQAGRVPCFR